MEEYLDKDCISVVNQYLIPYTNEHYKEISDKIVKGLYISDSCYMFLFDNILEEIEIIDNYYDYYGEYQDHNMLIKLFGDMGCDLEDYFSEIYVSGDNPLLIIKEFKQLEQIYKFVETTLKGEFGFNEDNMEDLSTYLGCHYEDDKIKEKQDKKRKMLERIRIYNENKSDSDSDSDNFDSLSDSDL